MTQAPERTDLVTLTIDGVEVSVPKGTLVIRAAEEVGISIPRFCDHPLLDPVGACRQCLVDVPDAGNGRGMGKPQASCTIAVAEGMVVNTQATSPVAAKAQEGMMEFLLINHPLDCPVCDKGGECPLQNQAMSNGRGESRFSATGGVKRTFPKPINISPQILLDRERCIVCQRCTRFAAEIAGDPFIALVERGAQQQIGIAEDHPFNSYFAGNTIQICPVGALTSESYRFRSRPFDLVSTPSIAEHDACGSAIRVDHRRGKVMRRLSGDDPAVNEEWITDKDRFAFGYTTTPDRLTHPLVRDADSGELRAASWPEAFAVAARGLAATEHAAVLTGGRLTREDAYAYAKFARTVLGTNDIDFRARAHSAEEAAFLANHVVGRTSVTYADLEAPRTVVLLGLEPEDEAGTIFLRLRKGFRHHRTRVFAVAPYSTRGLTKAGGTLIPAAPGEEPTVIAGLVENADVALDAGGVILVGERLVEVPGALGAAAELAERTGARLAWVPRRAGDRGALEAGAFPTLLPGGRAVADDAARAALAASWGVEELPEAEGRDTTAILEAAVAGTVDALVVGGVELADLPDPELARAALEKASFVVSLELRTSAVTELADVVLPVAPVVDKSGSFVNWEGRVRPFDTALGVPGVLPDVRVLGGIAEELDVPFGLRTPEQAAAELDRLGSATPPAQESVEMPAPAAAPAAGAPARDGLVLASWKQLIDDGRMQVAEPTYHESARPLVALVGSATLESLGVAEGDAVELRGPRGALVMPVGIAEDMADGVVWAAATVPGAAVRTLVGPSGCPVTITPVTITPADEGGNA